MLNSYTYSNKQIQWSNHCIPKSNLDWNREILRNGTEQWEAYFLSGDGDLVCLLLSLLANESHHLLDLPRNFSVVHLCRRLLVEGLQRFCGAGRLKRRRSDFRNVVTGNFKLYVCRVLKDEKRDTFFQLIKETTRQLDKEGGCHKILCFWQIKSFINPLLLDITFIKTLLNHSLLENMDFINEIFQKLFWIFKTIIYSSNSIESNTT